MSPALPYLQKLRKSDLTELAEASNLEDYGPMRKPELEIALDDHLRANQTLYQNDPSFGDYYKRLGPVSPTRQIASMIFKPEAAEGKPKRKKSKGVDEPTTSSESGALVARKVSSMVKTPGRSSLSLPSSVPLPPSPAVVTDAIDRQTTKLRRHVSGLYSESGINETSDALRDVLSSSVAISIVSLVAEAYGLRQEILPSKLAGFVPAIPGVMGEKTPIYLPDLFLLLDRSFWAPFSLWNLTSILLPLLCAYFVNIPQKMTSSYSHGTRRNGQVPSSSPFDPLVYNIAKAFTAYLVYAQHCTFLGLFQHFTIATVNESVLGGYQGIIIGSAIAGALGFYEAILKRR